MNDTIAAIATPYGYGGIGVIRISGPDAFGVAMAIFSPGKKFREKAAELVSHQALHGYIIHPDSQDVIDEVLLLPMKGPRSYTAEDVIEVQAHSGTVVLKSILELIVSQGARLAEPGEFTKRAFLNGRIDLTQAEAVADVINARSTSSLKIASSQNLGTLKNQIQHIRSQLVDFLAILEAGIDFPEDVAEFEPTGREVRMMEALLEQCGQFIQLHKDACFLKDGIRIVICGAPNVGKSSLMNRMLGQERSIVTAVPGTTRDPIEEPLNMEGVPIVISDTAGIHQTDDLVEIIGIEKAKDRIETADLVLFMNEAGTRFSEKEFEKMVPSGKKAILVVNKIDVNPEAVPHLSEKYNHLPVVNISALYGKGIKTLQKKIIQICMAQLDVDGSGGVVPNLRHKKALEETVVSLEMVKEGLLSGRNEEILAMDVKSAVHSLGLITGESASLDILDTIFNNFCIGK